jgi:hypothetical protein
LKGVNRLRFVCITHFDLDHIRGLALFLKERFSDLDAQGRRQWRIDQVICPLFKTTLEAIAKLKALTRSSVGKQFFADLAERAEEMSEETNSLLDALCQMTVQTIKTSVPLEFPPFGVGTLLFCPPPRVEEAKMGPWKIACLGPQDRTSQIYSQQVQNGFLNSQAMSEIFSEVQSNSTSRVLALRHEPTTNTILLTGDSPIDELEAAMLAWQRLEKSAGNEPGLFHGVKVSHHGAKTCHLPDIYEKRSDVHLTKAIVCAEDDGVHPHQEVVIHVAKHVHACKITGDSVSPTPSRPRGIGTPIGLARPNALVAEDIILKIDQSGIAITGGRTSRFDLVTKQTAVI